MGGYIYILTNKYNTTLYIGVTNNLVRRLYEHVKRPTERGFVTRYNLHHLVYAEAHPGIVEAILREKQLKKWSRKKKDALIRASNPEFRDLAVWYEGEDLPEIELPWHNYGPLDFGA